MKPKRPDAFEYEFEKSASGPFYLYDLPTMFEVYRKAALEIKAYARDLENYIDELEEDAAGEAVLNDRD